VGPLFSWRKTSTDSLRRQFSSGRAWLPWSWWGALLAAGMRSTYALISFRLLPVRGVDGFRGVL